jgi:predicted PurR-regulated permease PerM
MAASGEPNKAMAIIGAVVLSAAAYQASTVFAPVVLALFVIAIVWPLQRRLVSWLPALLALAVTIFVTVAVCVAFASLAAWGFSRVGRSLIGDAGRYQALYEGMIAWLDGHGISIADIWYEQFNVRWLLRAGQQITGRVNTTLAFWLIALVYVLLGLLEVEAMRRRVEALDNREAARALLNGAAATAAKCRRYMLVRTQMSTLTGLFVGIFAWIAGLQFAVEWGVIAFALNYIPFIGPFVATLFPTLVAITQFQSWQAVLLVFACLNIIQFMIGSYIEPRVSGHILSISPPVVLFSILFWTFLWGLFGTFIGVPIAIAFLTFCEQYPSTRWLAELLGGPPRLKDAPD